MGLFAIKPDAPDWGVIETFDPALAGGVVVAAVVAPVPEFSYGDVCLVMECFLAEVRTWIGDDGRLEARLMEFYTGLLDAL